MKKIIYKIIQTILNMMMAWKRFYLVKRKGINYILDLKEAIDRAIFLRGWEPSTISYLQKNLSPEDVVIEVGANIGAHSLTISKIIGPNGHLHAIEPTDFAYNKLSANFILNPNLATNTSLHKKYVSNKELAEVSKIRSSWQIDKTPKSEEAMDEDLNVEIITLDEFFKDLDRLDFIKIDIDGFDYKALSGGEYLIKKFRPKVFIELGEYHLNLNGDSCEDILDFLNSYNYLGELETGEAIVSADQVKEILKKQSHINALFTQKI